jgi:hypothetical protein
MALARGLDPRFVQVSSVPRSPGWLSQNKFGGPPGNRSPSFALQARRAPRERFHVSISPKLARVCGIEPPARDFGDLGAPCAHPYIGTGVRDRTSIT